MAWVAVIGAGGAIAGGLMSKSGGSSQSGTQTVTNKNEMDPRTAAMLFGGDGSQGLLNQYQGMLGKPQSAGINQYGQANDAYLGNGANDDLTTLRLNSMGQIQGSFAPSDQMSAASVNAPAQNGMNLTGSYDKFINGDAGANPYLTKSIGGALDQSTNQFRQMQGDATDNLMRNVMPSIRSNSVLTGQYGGSRQGVAEGNAISDFTKQQGQAMTQFGQNNTNAAVGAQAQSFNQGQDRALSATQGLGAQQYGVASQDAAAQQAANAANLQSKMGANTLAAQVKQNGMSNLNGMMQGAYGVGQNQDAYALNQAKGVNGLLAPYLGQVPGSSTSSQPLYSNTMGNMIGGATAGLGLGQKLGGLFSGYSGGYGTGGGRAGDYSDNMQMYGV